MSGRSARNDTTRVWRLLVLLLLCVPVLGCAMNTRPDAPISLAVVNAEVWTGDIRRPWADAIAVRGVRIAAVGSSVEVRKPADGGALLIDGRG